MKYDVFISYASEDKREVSIPLALKLKELGLRVWLDEFELTIGDSIRRSIDFGLSESQYGIVILSQSFFNKEWPRKELDGLFTRDDGKEKLILPVWHDISFNDVKKFSPILADKIAVSTNKGIEYVANQIFKAIKQKSSVDINNSITNNRESLINDELSIIRKRILSSRSYRELKETQYILENLLTLYPKHPEARLLHDELLEAIEFERAVPKPCVKRLPAPMLMRLSFVKLIIPLIGGIGLIYLLYRFILWLIEMIK